jgi:type II secretory pathway component GspD/PulD (secretin)
MLPRLLACALVALAALPVVAQDRPAAETKRGAYVLKFAAAKDLAGVLAKHFKGAAEIQAGPAGASNCLLINAPPAVFDEVLKTLELLDRRPRSVAVEVFVVELPAAKGDEKPKRPDEKDLSGALGDVESALNAMQKKGQVAGFRHIRLTTLEGQPASLLLGENKPYTTGSAVTATGIATRSIMYRDLGTQVKVTPQVAADGTVTLDLNLQDSRARESTTATVGKDGKGNPIPATEFLLTTLTAKVGVASGKAALAKDAKVVSKEGEGETLIVVGARVVEPEPRPK